MSLIKRVITVNISLNGDTFDGTNSDISITGLRTSAMIQSYSGSVGSFANQMSMRISGMSNRDMAKLSTLGFSSGVYTKNAITVLAGDEVSGMTQVFSGAIMYGNVNYNAMPDVGVDIVASATADLQFAPTAGSSFKGDMSVASMLSAIAANAHPPMGFVNNGVTAKLSNHAVGGVSQDQIEDICVAAGINWAKRPDANGLPTLYIWPQGKTIDDQIIDMSGATGMVGYPTYSFRGLDVTSLFNPSVQVGRQMKVTSTTPPPAANAPKQTPGMGQSPGANGTFYVWGVTHNLSSETVNGPWFTLINLGNNNTSARG